MANLQPEIQHTVWDDFRDAAGQLCHIHHGKYGMDKVNMYQSSINFDGMPLDLVVIKLKLNSRLNLNIFHKS